MSSKWGCGSGTRLEVEPGWCRPGFQNDSYDGLLSGFGGYAVDGLVQGGGGFGSQRVR
jgi:hypothetical protein